MKLILREDVDNLGRLGEIVTVKSGYGRNYLIPQGMAMLATDGNLKVFESERAKLQARMDTLRTDAESLAERIQAQEVEILVRVGEAGKLYGSVTSVMIAEAFAEQGVDVERRKILLEEPIRSLGFYDVPVKLEAGITATAKVKVGRVDGGPIDEFVEAPAEEAEVEGSPEAPVTVADVEAASEEAPVEAAEEAVAEAVEEAVAEETPAEAEASEEDSEQS
ncbi:MAG: 50S ribosomal protein L9 [Desulfovibrio sp.]|nr:MAG: 50S ribosomal protein L9 [Desulfovibrio sp.]